MKPRIKKTKGGNYKVCHPSFEGKLFATYYQASEARDSVAVPSVKDGEADWATPCMNCDAVPTVHPTELCGPCCFGEADTINGNW